MGGDRLGSTRNHVVRASTPRREDLKGGLFALLELHYSVDVVAEHQLLPRLRELPAVVIPNAYELTENSAGRCWSTEGGRQPGAAGREMCPVVRACGSASHSTARESRRRTRQRWSERLLDQRLAEDRALRRKPSPIAASPPKRRQPENRRPPWLREAKAASPPSMDHRFDLRQNAVGYDPGSDWLDHA